jgi:hypothetical protein
LKINEKAKNLTQRIINHIDYEKSDSFMIGSTVLASQIYKVGSEEEAEKIAVANKLPIIKSPECIKKLRDTNKIPETDDLIIVNTRMDEGVNNLLESQPFDSFNTKIFNLRSKEQLDTGICKNDTFEVKMPVKNITKDELIVYKEYKSQGIDIYDPNDPAFNSRCINIIENNTDTTLNYRRENIFSNKSLSCSGDTTNCTYKGIDENAYMTCECEGIDTVDSIFQKMINMALELLTNLNFDILFCYMEVFNVSNTY